MVSRTVNDERLSKRFLQAAAGSALMGSSAAMAGMATGWRTRGYAAGPLTAFLLACNWFGNSFFEASCRLGGKTAGRRL